MSKIKNPIRFSEHFNIPSDALKKLGIFDPILTADTPLFIDPLLMEHSNHEEMRAASQSYRSFFEEIMTLLEAVERQDTSDVAWKEVHRRMSFHELPGTCLGYGAGNIRGSGWGKQLTEQVMLTASQIVEKGVKNTDLFMMLGLFEDGIGPDRISDMVTNIISPDLITLNQRIATEFKLPVEQFGFFGDRIKGSLPRNPFERNRTPIILVPNDVLRDLPVALDYDDVIDAARKNAALRNRLNTHLGGVWRTARTRRDKHDLKKNLLTSKEALEAWLDAIRSAPASAYDQERDEEGIIRWVEIANNLAKSAPLKIEKPIDFSVKSLRAVVDKIIEQFRWLMEDRDLWKEMWLGTKHRTEKTAQRLFFAVASSYCTANKLDITPEADTGNGPVDFKFVSGGPHKLLVEIKLSSGTVEHGYATQLPTYVAAEKADDGIFMVLDVGKLGKKFEKIQAHRRSLLGEKKHACDIVYVNCQRRESASKR
ncbi:hypothetical protein [Burkholderia ubonensis]|uniref:hypothetical protein n=1 Tax=Burkholderia ubonensis TaxID=101571 RepID=UPI000AFEF412|nr:hypothetical protein [Burkholderia ubonensis]